VVNYGVVEHRFYEAIDNVMGAHSYDVIFHNHGPMMYDRMVGRRYLEPCHVQGAIKLNQYMQCNRKS